MENVIDKKVVHSCGHRGEIDVVLTTRNQYAWRNLFEQTPCNACLWIDVENEGIDIANVDVRILGSL